MILRASLGLLALLPIASHAVVYNSIDAEQSAIRFQYEQMGVEMDGSFAQLSGELQFDTEAVADSHVALTVNLTSVDTGLEEADQELTKPEWFNSAKLPEAHFRSSSIEQQSDNRYLVKGTLEIKGQQQEVSFTADYTQQAEHALLQGQLPIKRGDFKIGEGTWSGYEILANEVLVDFTIAIK